jgi:hypothetical protein
MRLRVYFEPLQTEIFERKFFDKHPIMRTKSAEGPGNHIPFIDFMGTTARSSRPLVYFPLTAALLLIAFAGRRLRMAYA